jgi:DNA-directed RNA polymerase sigma subunit (sigma70/sigma32)
MLGQLNEREMYVFNNHILNDEPMTLREIAKVFDCHNTSILRDKERVLKKLRIESDGT